MRTLVIIRGIPGSGKSTLANALIEQDYAKNTVRAENWKPPVHCEADMFFSNSKGEYHYIPHLVPTAHEWCKRKIEEAMVNETPLVIVSNTCTLKSRVDQYVDLALVYGYSVQQIVCFASFGSIHPGIAEERMERFRSQLRNSLTMELKMGELV